ncbi:MAG: thiol:disulfide interchange protein DsbA/DsbL [Pasteurellaceae bacterium]|nr:thiol:disulfide interchange protein DsbA/DsbL [Pasteurellaceae bacterium]
MKKSIFYGLLSLLLGISAFADSANNKGGRNVEKVQNEPLFKDGKGYYSYKQPLDIALPDNKILIQYFYQYGCNVCLKGDDYLKAYAERNADKVVLQRAPAFEKGNVFTAQMQATFVEYGRPELADKYLFDSADTHPARKLINDNEAIKRWLTQNQVDIDRFHQLFASEKIHQQVEKAHAFYQIYAPPLAPIAVLNGKYILIHNTLYNDDYTYAVLDFLVDKLHNEKQQTQENK